MIDVAASLGRALDSPNSAQLSAASSELLAGGAPEEEEEEEEEEVTQVLQHILTVAIVTALIIISLTTISISVSYRHC